MKEERRGIALRHPVVPRNQLELYSHEEKARLYGLACDPKEDKARPEFKADCDVTSVLARHGYPTQPLVFGEFDETVTLHSALQAVAEVQQSYDRLPANVRQAYPTLDALMRAVRTGEFRVPEAPASGSGGGSGTPPSEARQEGAP